VRLLAVDDQGQNAEAITAFEAGQIRIARTVLLETVWVPRKEDGFEDGSVHAALTGPLGLDNVHADDEETVTESNSPA
jgi:hypothetical protein